MNSAIDGVDLQEPVIQKGELVRYPSIAEQSLGKDATTGRQLLEQLSLGGCDTEAHVLKAGLDVRPRVGDEITADVSSVANEAALLRLDLQIAEMRSLSTLKLMLWQHSTR